MYTITILNDKRERIKWLTFSFYHQARTWMLLNGFLDNTNLAGETAQLKRRFK